MGYFPKPLSKVFFVIGTLAATNTSYLHADPVPVSPSVNHASIGISPTREAHGTLGFDLGYLMPPAEVNRKFQNFDGQVREQIALSEIVQVGGRALQWTDLFQKNVPEEQREQVWRRIDRIGHEATVEEPMVYNPQTILQSFEEAMAITPESVKAILESRATLPETIPEDTNLQDVMAAIRKIHTAYSRASRWLALYPLRSQIRKDLRDLRPWIILDRQKEALRHTATDWRRLSKQQKQAWVQQVSTACSIGGIGSSACRLKGAALTHSRNATNASKWLDHVLAEGHKVYNSKFGVTHAHNGVAIHQQSDGQINVVFSMLNITNDVFNWIAQQVAVGWDFPGTISAKLAHSQNSFPGVVKVDWQEGALPHVESIGGDTITMDSNTAKWLEHTQVTMTHEFGHVIGFPDCYVEFWDADLQSFVFYTLDPEDRMCALSGTTQERHKQALLTGFAH